jgi:hypothetical protein
VLGWHRTGWKVARYQPRWGTADDGDLVVLGVQTLQSYRSIHIAVSSDMDIPMTYASLD